ncbi:EscU/YscU/HrcU family type III secretion system export apparatus switch protein [Herbaspirillum sp. RTI4]|uniref:EscU/YscU/HrcU family type III secretion system export apparatus switch protein n=1 Tax=Herbaspirillum sp. RTI4 TaxID=3048640 RepID=UPI002AB500A0|nr:EscU/YscU/HrcU family type III secretion system export apparatus switch protein [Herbaspirillum sp. RTI4]MDY7577158.1 EscU/YscU/HrcU family type III secretion system export apparatus switch protein [Herbaspirillum sp. RTI4]MEA9980448.1 EscU/YscU/HrcU family type III secretion system export apparatus switch protein [Herbaspirillum sp. RTI4]
MADSSSDKPHKPSAKRLRDARQRGEVVRSAEVTSAVVFVGATALLVLSMGLLVARIASLWMAQLQAPLMQAQEFHAGKIVQQVVQVWLLSVLPFVGVALCAALVGSLCQVGGLLVFSRIKPDVSRLNPAAGMKKLFSAKNGVNTMKMLIKVVMLGAAGYFYLAHSLAIPVRSVYASPWTVLYVAGQWLTPLLAVAAVVYLLMALVDYLYERYEFMKQQRMSSAELRKEQKENQGDPLIRGKRRAASREALLFGLRERMQFATAVVHSGNTAIALAFDGGVHAKVIAKGVGEAGARLREEAKARLVPMREDAYLTDAIMRAVMLDQPLGEPHFTQVQALFDWAGGRS